MIGLSLHKKKKNLLARSTFLMMESVDKKRIFLKKKKIFATLAPFFQNQNP